MNANKEAMEEVVEAAAPTKKETAKERKNRLARERRAKAKAEKAAAEESKEGAEEPPADPEPTEEAPEEPPADEEVNEDNVVDQVAALKAQLAQMTTQAGKDATKATKKTATPKTKGDLLVAPTREPFDLPPPEVLSNIDALGRMNVLLDVAEVLGFGDKMVAALETGSSGRSSAP